MLLLLIQGGILSLLLFTRKYNVLSNCLLGGFTGAIFVFYGIELFEFYFPGITEGYWIFPFAFCKLLLPKLLFLYTKSLAIKSYYFKLKEFRITIITTIFFGLWYLVTINSTSFDVFTNSIYGMSLTGICLIYWLIYLPRSYGMIKAALKEKLIASHFYSLLRVLFLIIIISLIFEVADDLNDHLEFFFEFDFFNFIDVLFLILIYYISYKALSQPQIFQDIQQLMPKPKLQARYSNSKLTDEKLLYIQNKLEELMQKEKLYLHGDLNIQQVADKLSISRQYITQALNDKMKYNFNDYINQYRIEEFKKKAKDPKYSQYTILALALDSGFNSKTSFNTIFKKNTGITPSQYKKESLK